MEDDYWNNQPQLSESAGSINQPQLSQAVGLLNQPHLEYVAETPQSGMPSAQVVDPQSIGQSILLAYQRYLDSVVISEAENAPTFFCGPELATAGGSGSTIPDPRPSPALRDPRPSAALRDPRPSPALRDPRPSPALHDPRPSPALRDPRPSPALRDPRPSPALRDPRPSPALRDPRPSPALRDPRPSPALRDPRPSPALRDPRPSPALRDPHPSPALRDPRPSSALRDPRPSPALRDPRPSARGKELAIAGGSIPSLGVGGGPELSKAGGSIPALVVGGGPELARVGGSIPALGVRRGPELSRAGGSIPALGVRRGPDGRRRSHETLSLPPDASSTLYIEGLPSDCTRREAAHIFRRFTGYKELRLVKRDSKYPAKHPLILGFVDFENPTYAATALRALQAYIMDEHDNNSPYLRLQFSKFPGRRLTGRGKR